MLDVLYQIKEVTGRHMMPFIIMILTIHLINLWGEGVGGRGHDNFNILTGIFFRIFDFLHFAAEAFRFLCNFGGF